MLDGIDIPIPFTSGSGGQSAKFSPFDALAKTVGGQDYQDYEQAAKTFEAAMLPIISGAAVTESEARRQIRANLPEFGDTPQTLSRKATNRAMMLNAAADLLGVPRPFPKVGTMDLPGTRPGSQPRPGQVAPKAAPATGAPKIGEVRRGFRYNGGPPGDRNSWSRAQ